MACVGGRAGGVVGTLFGVLRFRSFSFFLLFSFAEA
jgi:hypothetical protein